jgi:methylated-DNA-[protein]-cysteine S-methyltransferase
MAQAIVTTPVGPLLLESSANALISLTWHGENAPPPTTENDPLLTDAARQIAAYFARRLTRFDLPLRPAGSGFQQRVWGAISAIPYGQTRAYGELARTVGSAARAVGQACGQNPLPILIPCHRVLDSTGGLTGYSGAEGVTTKEFLLRLEGATLL